MSESSGSSVTLAVIDPADFVAVIDNPYLTLKPGTTFFSESEDGAEHDRFAVTRETKNVMGVTCVVVRHTAYEDDEVVEIALDYFAQDKDGTVWYFGEFVRNYENGEVVNNNGSWLAGVDGAEPGIIMKASPVVGDEYDQENAPGIAEDHAEVVSLDATVSVPYGAVGPALETEETNPLEAGLLEHKYYVPGVGLVREVDINTGDAVALVKIRYSGTGGNDTLVGNIGADEIFGRDGKDDLNGRAGSDIIRGGTGNDSLNGGNDRVADFLHGEKGNDVIRVGEADLAFGGDGHDLFLLSDRRGFGVIDGGGQPADDLGRVRGDILRFDGRLDLTAPGVGERIEDIETLSMKDGEGDDRLVLSAREVLSLGDGEFDLPGRGESDEGSAVRVDGDAGDRVRLKGGRWAEIDPANAPQGYDVFVCDAPAGLAYLLVQEHITVVM